jgi:hypothetical protein
MEPVKAAELACIVIMDMDVQVRSFSARRP